jgi:hypothetical protein
LNIGTNEMNDFYMVGVRWYHCGDCEKGLIQGDTREEIAMITTDRDDALLYSKELFQTYSKELPHWIKEFCKTYVVKMKFGERIDPSDELCDLNPIQTWAVPEDSS